MSTIIVAEDGDLLAEVVEWDHDQPWINQEPIIRGTQLFKVSRKVLMEASEVFKFMLGGEWKEAHQAIVTLKDWTIASMKIWFQVLHNVTPNFDVPIQAMWHMVKIADYHRIDLLRLKDWFATWYERRPIDDWYAQYQTLGLPNPKWLLYPCWAFDHPKGFMRATEFCAYRYTHHVGEYNPTRFYDLHLPPRIILDKEQLNAAKGRLRTILHRELYEPNDKLLRATCTCKEKTLWGYEKALTVCGAWPLERVAQSTAMYDILGHLGKFSYELPSSACSVCRQDYGKVVEKGKRKTDIYFGGLCLDCMNKSKSKNQDRDYWKHSDLKEHEFVYGCRAGKHTQPSWYFSYMGRRQRQDQLYRAQKMGRYESDSD
ncbi:MAG: hypothetical protein L6R38_007907 [Xanthoria sp. 2 TBL-2021]|nr:MAG: hypothetical protein L6R38_007907 [Xanthoria sp. 2 TBL-2021]